MIPYGKASKKKHNYLDNHPKKGYNNWWEESTPPNQKRARQRAKIEMEKEMSINILDEQGNPIIKLDENDSKKDVIIQDGKEVPLSDAIKEVKKIKTDEE